MGSTMVFLPIRVLHVLLAATWLGATVFITFLLMPVVDSTGPAGGQVMIGLNKKGLNAFFASMGGLTVLTGIYLYWRFTGGFDPAISRTNAGMAFGIGGLAGLLATIFGGAIVGRSAKGVVALMEQMSTITDGARKAAIVQEANVLKGKLSTWGMIVLLLQVVATVLMALGHYI